MKAAGWAWAIGSALQRRRPSDGLSSPMVLARRFSDKTDESPISRRHRAAARCRLERRTRTPMRRRRVPYRQALVQSYSQAVGYLPQLKMN
jgi:hypothetical protein